MHCLLNLCIWRGAEAVRINQWIEIKHQRSECGDGETFRGAPDGFNPSFEKLKTEKQSMTACHTAPQSTYRGLCTHCRDI